MTSLKSWIAQVCLTVNMGLSGNLDKKSQVQSIMDKRKLFA